MGFKQLAIAGAATAALSAGLAAPAFAAPAFAAAPGHHSRPGHGCAQFCVAKVSKAGVTYGTVHVFVGHGQIRGVLHLTKDAKKGFYKIKGHCKPVAHHEHEHGHEHAHEVERTFFHHQVRFIPRSSGTGFGGASGDELNLPLTGGALAMIAGGLGVGLLARRRISGARS